MTEIQFGVMLIFNMCLGNITPPVGSVLFVGCGIGHVSIEQVTSKLIPTLWHWLPPCWPSPTSRLCLWACPA